MNEDTIRNEVSLMIWQLGFTFYHPPDMRPMFDRGKPKPVEEEKEVKSQRAKRDVGRIDLIFPNPLGETILVETKAVRMEDGPRMGHNGILRFNAISTSQRKTLDRWVFKMTGQGFLGIGTIDQVEQRRLWMVPWDHWVDREIDMFQEHGFKGMPVHSSKAMGMDELLQTYECEWLGTKGDVHWKLPDGHPILKIKAAPHVENEWDAVSLRFDEKGDRTE